MQKLGGLGVRGHPRSLETSPFDRAHMTSYSTLIETMPPSCTVYRIIVRFPSKVANFNPPRSNFAVNCGVRKLESRGYRVALLRDPAFSCLIQYRSVTDRHTDRQTHTDRHTTTAYTALSIASRGNKMYEYYQRRLLTYVRSAAYRRSFPASF